MRLRLGRMTPVLTPSVPGPGARPAGQRAARQGQRIQKDRWGCVETRLCFPGTSDLETSFRRVATAGMENNSPAEADYANSPLAGGMLFSGNRTRRVLELEADAGSCPPAKLFPNHRYRRSRISCSQRSWRQSRKVQNPGRLPKRLPPPAASHCARHGAAFGDSGFMEERAWSIQRRAGGTGRPGTTSSGSIFNFGPGNAISDEVCTVRVVTPRARPKA